jgi:mycothiol S-conjugate amidase
VHDASLPAYTAAGDPSYHPELGDPWSPQKLYYIQWSRASLIARHQAFIDLGLESPFKSDRWKRNTSMDYQLTTKVFVGDQWEQVQAALLAHATQVDPNSKYWFGLPPDIDRAIYPYDDYILAHSAVSTRLPEDDLFQGVVGDNAAQLTSCIL